MVALADSNPEVEVKAIGAALHCSMWTVHRWILRSKTTGDLHDRPRPGRPARLYSEEAKLRIVAFYCQTQPLPDCGRWSLRWAARHLEANPTRVGVSPSKSTLHRVLQNNRLKPHQSRYFLHITDPDFFPKMEHLVGLYRNPPRHLFFFDECPGIQVIKRLTPDLRTESMRQRLKEFEYIRNGTLDVFAFLHHDESSGTQMELRTLTKLLRLMKNLLDDYASEVSEDSWHQLVEALSSQSEGIVSLIEQEKGPLRKRKAQDAVASLTEALRKRGLEIDALAV